LLLLFVEFGVRSKSLLLLLLVDDIGDFVPSILLGLLGDLLPFLKVNLL
jgi:hypothetical protein